MRIEVRIPPDIDTRWLERAVEDALAATLKGAAQLVANDAKLSIARGPKTGLVYTTRFKTNRTSGRVFPTETRVPHQASAPGEAPATDTGKLVGSIVAGARGLEAFVEARSAYAVHLEYGTRTTAARPFLRPAAERQRERIATLLRAAVATAIARFHEKNRG